MSVILKKVIFLSLFMTTIVCAKIPNDSAVVDKMLMANTLKGFSWADFLPKRTEEFFSNTDQAILYYADFAIINPTKKEYQVDIICLDTKNNIIFNESKKTKLKNVPEHVGDDLIKHQVQFFQLDPKLGAMVKGQLMPLQSGYNYLIKLYIDKKLVGISRFTYEVGGIPKSAYSTKIK